MLRKTHLSGSVAIALVLSSLTLVVLCAKNKPLSVHFQNVRMPVCNTALLDYLWPYIPQPVGTGRGGWGVGRSLHPANISNYLPHSVPVVGRGQRYAKLDGTPLPFACPGATMYPIFWDEHVHTLGITSNIGSFNPDDSSAVGAAGIGWVWWGCTYIH